MLTTTGTLFSHVKPDDKPWRSDGLRDFFLYRVPPANLHDVTTLPR